jgi:hypothetical protein
MLIDFIKSAKGKKTNLTSQLQKTFLAFRESIIWQFFLHQGKVVQQREHKEVVLLAGINFWGY